MKKMHAVTVLMVLATVEDGGAVVLHMKCGVECLFKVVFATSARTEKMVRRGGRKRCCDGA